jgi:hypothetical protein
VIAAHKAISSESDAREFASPRAQREDEQPGHADAIPSDARTEQGETTNADKPTTNKLALPTEQTTGLGQRNQQPLTRETNENGANGAHMDGEQAQAALSPETIVPETDNT